MGGPARVSCIWGKCLEEKGYKVELLSDYHEQNSISYKFNQSYILEKSKKLNLINLFFSLFKILKSKKEEILVFNKGNYIIPLLICKILLPQLNNNKLVYYVHGGTKNFKTYYGNFKSRIMEIIFQKVVCLYDNFDKNQNFYPTKSFMRKITDIILTNNYNSLKEKIVFIPNPINFTIDSIKFSNRNKTILSVGRLDKIKRFDLLISAFNEIKNDIVGWNLEIAGGGPEELKLNNLVDELKLHSRVKLLGEITNIHEVYQRASIFSLASIFEGMPMVILEAFEHGLPVVGFKNDGTDFLVKHGYNGLKSDIYDIENFKLNLKILVNETDKRMLFSDNSKLTAKSFHTDQLIKNWDEILKSN
tara:strand:+ start:565 stop:1647 length:1083 start_codon:yes stop_codon:yes gene_type:complete